MRRRDLIAATAGALAATAFAGGVAWAAIPGSDGTIQGCYGKFGGILRVIDVSKGERCLSVEVPISWSQRGQKGDPGAAGAPGSPGTPGAKGDKGDQGIQGPQGIQGLPGTNGANGTNGVDGNTGQPGKDGINGTNGTNGIDGNDGQPGADGVSVTTAAEPAGANCATGGAKLTAVGGVNYVCNGMKGDTGAQGPAGTPGALSGYQLVDVPFTIAGSGETGASANCPPGKKVVGGGFVGGRANNQQDPIVMLLSSVAFTSTVDGWVITVSNKAVASFSGVVQAICVTG